MRRALVYILLPLIAAAGSIANLVAFRLENLMDPGLSDLTTAVWYAAFAAIVVLALLAMFRRNVWLLVLSLIMIIAAGFAPRIVDVYEETTKAAVEQAEGADVEMEFQSAYLDRSDDVEARITAKNPYTAAEALEFLEFAADADLSWRSLPDHTPEIFALVEQAIDGGILDPNALMPTPTADSPAVTVTLAFYDKRIKPASPHTIKKHDWDVLQILVAKGADVSMADAASLRADLARTVVLGEGRFIELQ
jgi:hypothetical protein